MKEQRKIAVYNTNTNKLETNYLPATRRTEWLMKIKNKKSLILLEIFFDEAGKFLRTLHDGVLVDYPRTKNNRIVFPNLNN